MLPFDNTQLTGVINKRRPVRTPIADAHFKTRRQVATNSIQYDILDGPEGLNVAISHGVKSKRAAQGNFNTQTYTLPRFTEHDTIMAKDLLGIRAPGTVNRSQALMQLYNYKLDLMRSRIDRTTEYMAIRALQGSVMDGGGNTLATYSVDNPVAVDLSTGNPVDIFDDAAVDIAQALGGFPGGLIAYCGTDAYKKLRNNDKIQSLLTGPAGPQMIEGGEVRRVGGVTIRRLPHVFRPEGSSTDQPFLDANRIILASNEMGGELVYGPCEGKGGRVSLTNYLVDAWEENDPPATMLRVESNPLPVVTRPSAIKIFEAA